MTKIPVDPPSPERWDREMSPESRHSHPPASDIDIDWEIMGRIILGMMAFIATAASINWAWQHLIN